MQGYLVVNLPSKERETREVFFPCALPHEENRGPCKPGNHVIYVSHGTAVDEDDADCVSVLTL